MGGHSVFPIGKEKTKSDITELKTILENAQKIKAKNNKELANMMEKFLSNPKERTFQSLNEKQVIYMSLIQTLLDIKTKEVRDKLIEIRAQMDIPRQTMIPQTKQRLTNLIKELK